MQIGVKRRDLATFRVPDALSEIEREKENVLLTLAVECRIFALKSLAHVTECSISVCRRAGGCRRDYGARLPPSLDVMALHWLLLTACIISSVQLSLSVCLSVPLRHRQVQLPAERLTLLC